MSNELIQALIEIEKERGIPKDALIDAIKVALNTAYKKNFGTGQNVKVDFNEITGEVSVHSQKRVVAEVKDPRLEISLEEARELYPDSKEDDLIYVEVTPTNFGRIAAQTAKQVVIQKLREAERSIIYEEFLEREGEILTGTIQRIENRTVYISLGRTEAIMLPADQISTEKYEVGQRIKAYIYEVKNTSKGPNIFVSRSHPNFLKRLFELEVPEIYDGVVEIKSIAREAGSRSKISVYSQDDKIDPVGACVGPRGLRVQNIVSELNGEKIDIIKYDRDPERFIANSLSPSKVTYVDINEEEKIARVVVPDYQLSLAIGKEGQNARLAAKLTGWKVDIKSESQAGLHEEVNDIDEEA
ncbi:MAG TPA: transcription termination factor NusA [Syntrophomonadaceae bacterium]|nr:transcription termination factor NusA [Syntrophomonadaceae bacterium]HPU48881.1 transcription termination factor NusA [Syntrophomonadaceae bacterium]